MTIYYRPIIQTENSKPDCFFYLGNQRLWFDKVEIIERGKLPVVVCAQKIPTKELKNITGVRNSSYLGSFKKPFVMGILNITPDSFSDGGKSFGTSRAYNNAENMIAHGADIIDIGGESTRPGAKTISEDIELRRVEPVVKAIKSKYPRCKISVDTRKAKVMARVLDLGVDIINDVSSMTFDEKSVGTVAIKNAQICLMHGGLNPENMQEHICYSDVLLDVYDYLKQRIDFAIAGGINKERIIIDPGIGFGKTIEQNVLLIRKASIFHSLGCPILYGVSRKSFIGQIGGAPKATDRFPGSIAVAIELIRQGVQFIRVHDVLETRQALDLWSAINE